MSEGLILCTVLEQFWEHGQRQSEVSCPLPQMGVSFSCPELDGTHIVSTQGISRLDSLSYMSCGRLLLKTGLVKTLEVLVLLLQLTLSVVVPLRCN